MSSLTRCNYCSLQIYKAQVRQKNPAHTVELREVEGEMAGWLQPVELDEDGNVVQEFGSWFLEVGDSCVC